MLVAQLCSTLCDPMKPVRTSPMEFFRQEYLSGCHFLLQGIFPTQGLNMGLLHWKQILYHLSHQGSLLNGKLSTFQKKVIKIDNMKIFFYMLRRKVSYKILCIQWLIKWKQNMHMKKLGKKTSKLVSMLQWYEKEWTFLFLHVLHTFSLFHT